MARKPGYIVSLLGICIVTAVFRLTGEHINPTTVALGFLLLVLIVATRWGAAPAIFAAILSVLSLNFFFLPPIGTLTIADPDNWIALGAFLFTAITAGQLSANAKRRAEEAETGWHENERLYKELQEAFERASYVEALRQSEKLKASLLDAVTHNFRTPLTSIKASVTILLEDLQSQIRDSASLDREGRQEMLEVINEETDRLNRLVEGLIDIARIETGEMQLRFREEQIEEIIQTAIEMAQPIIRHHRIEVSIKENMPLMRVDARAMTEVLYTLLENAAKYSAPSTRIRINASCQDSDLLLSIEDEGKGISVELRERVFDKFFRAMRDGDMNADNPPGTGMGLTIARGIIEAHHGKIWIEDATYQKGTKVVLTIPIEEKLNVQMAQL
jgi:two-component system sensor histidine kinase KdpD